ncbi:superoxide dismutase [Prosthecobacter sp.]|uniref:superoxide dismutase n=1 Tax=Prosthecobacter sp. TaxID=1965333 RepID=UPI002ABBA643|nr:superoxide dismutase [Prosthecobacter sp.]MDZ4401200.1 superoxide dismutase [Prosthecobacter sp.]
MNRRVFLTTSTAALAGSLIVPASSHALDLTQSPLPYAPEALEPHIDAMTMNIHFSKHHAAYIKNLGDALKAASVDKTDPVALISDLKAVPEAQRMLIRNNGGGHVNHTWFWKWMAPAGSGPKGPEGKLGEAIQSTFTSIDDFKKLFSEAGTKRFGSGWAWLIVTKDGTLKVTSTPNQDNPLMKGILEDENLGTPILGLDVWEHAYYLKYQNKRPDYIAAWWNVVNWAEVAKQYAAAKKA